MATRPVAVATHRSHRGRENEITVAEYLTTWLAGKQALRPSTHASYASHVRLYLVPYLGTLQLSALSPLHIERMYGQIKAGNTERLRPVSAASMRRVHATLTSALSTAVRRGLIDRNPAVTVELPPAPKPRAAVWTAEVLSEFLDATREDRYWLLYLLLGLRGLRRGEGVALRWQNVDIERGGLRIEQSAVSVNGKTIIGPPKTSHGARVVALDSQTSALLEAHAERQILENRDRIGSPMLSEFVFTTPDGEPLDPAFVSRHFDRLVARHGLPRIRLHDLRHTSASLGLASGESLLEVSRRLGHSSITVTADIYSHVAPQLAQDSAERLAALITINR